MHRATIMKVGDIVICVDDSGLPSSHPKIKKGTKYVVSAVTRCCRVDVAIGLTMKATSSYCDKCGTSFVIDGWAYYESRRFRILEPEYRAVEVCSELMEEARELVKQKEKSDIII